MFHTVPSSPPAGPLTYNQCMSEVRRAIVLSDIHLGPEGPLAAFRDDSALAGFFRKLAAERSPPPTELILAGDCFDFLQVAGYDGFDPHQAGERFAQILRAPRTAEVMKALAELAGCPWLELTVLSGNHDPEMMVGDVRRLFEAAIGRREGTVRYADDDPPLRPAIGDQPPVWGRVLGEGTVWVVHGDRWDPSNMIHRDRLAEAIRAGQRFALPQGSHLVFEVLQKLKPTHRWVDELKPEMPAVLLLLLYLDPKTTWAHAQKHLGLTARLLTDTVKAQLQAGPLFGPSGPSGPSGSDGTTRRVLPGDPHAALAALLTESLRDESDPAAVLGGLDAYLRGRVAPAEGTLASHGGLRRHFARAWLAGIRDADRFQDETEPDAIHEVAAPHLPGHVRVLVAGHTHGKRLRPAPLPLYANSGTWIPVGAIPPGDLRSLIDQLEAGPAWPTEAPRTFVELDLGGSRPEVRLGACDADGTPRLKEFGHAP